MTTYHVWLTGQHEPDTVEAQHVFADERGLVFYDWDSKRCPVVRHFLKPHEWHRWAVVHDEAEHT